MRLFTSNLGGNLHQASQSINKMCPEIIPGIVTLSSDGYHTIVVYRSEQEAAALAPRPVRPEPPWGDHG